MPTVIIYRPVDASGASHRRLEAAGCRVVVEPIDSLGVPLAPDLYNADVLMGATFRGGVMNREFLSRFSALRLVSKYTIGYDDVDLDAATELGIAVTHCPTEANWGGVAEGTMASMLVCLKKVRERDRQVRAGMWRDESLRGRYVGARADGYPGLTIGIIGLGRVGSQLARLLAPWNARLIASDPYVPATRFEQLGVESVTLSRLLRDSDVITIHCALTPETRHLIGAAEFARMRPDALLINTARGAIVDLDALLQALESDQLAQAALDVFPEEPWSGDARVQALNDRLLLSPHMVAANAGGTLQAAIPWATDAVIEAVAGRWPGHVVNEDVKVSWLQRFGLAGTHG